MEFIGILIKKAVRFLFTLPGRASVDLMASWFGSSTVAVIISTTQYENGKYTAREAAANCMNFSIVSIPFCLIVWRTINTHTPEMYGLFPVMYSFLCITGFILAVITPRIWPLNRIPDTYDEISGKTINEEVPQGETVVKWAANAAAKKAEPVGAKHVMKSGVNIWSTLYLDLIPLVIAWGTIALIIAEETPVFTFLAWPFGQYMSLFGIQGAMEIAPAALVGFIDMFIPAFFLQGAALETKFRTC
jgi:nucleoside recognition membrane protein YjiH